MYNKLVKRLRNWAKSYRSDGLISYPAYDLDITVNVIEEPSKPRWIPVTDPPKHSDYYLVCDDCGRVYTAAFGSTIDWWLAGNVTHWMPLPEPPKEEG